MVGNKSVDFHVQVRSIRCELKICLFKKDISEFFSSFFLEIEENEFDFQIQHERCIYPCIFKFQAQTNCAKKYCHFLEDLC